MLKNVAVLAALLFIADAANAQRSFDADAAVADGENIGDDGARAGAENNAAADLQGGEEPVEELERQELIPVTSFPRTCECFKMPTVRVDDIRGISDEFAADGNALNTFGLSNMMWGFGQFLDHDLALTIEDEGGPTIEVGADNPSDPMELHRAITTFRSGCEATLNVHTAQVDAGPVYGTDEDYLQSTLRDPGTCNLRVSDGQFLPVSTFADDRGRFFMLAGDVRVSEHAFLAAQHTVWVREHNRVCAAVQADPAYDDMSVDGKFDLVRAVIVAKFQQVVLTEFLPALGISETDIRNFPRKINRPDVSVEFSIAYRLGHDIIPNTVGGIDITAAFNSEDFFLDMAGPPGNPSVTYKSSAASNIDNIMKQLSTTKCSQFDGKLSNSLRNFLFGASEGEDLAGRNIFRGRELGIPTYGGLAECFGIEPDATTEEETPDAWLGLLREPKAAGQPLGPTLKAIITEQFHRSFFGPGGFYWKNRRADVGDFGQEIETSKYATIISANTGVSVSGNVFKA